MGQNLQQILQFSFFASNSFFSNFQGVSGWHNKLRHHTYRCVQVNYIVVIPISVSNLLPTNLVKQSQKSIQRIIFVITLLQQMGL